MKAIYYAFFSIVYFYCTIIPYTRGVMNIPPDLLDNLGKSKIGLITNQTGVDQQGNRTIDSLLQKGISVNRMYTTEHGIQGTQRAGVSVYDTIDASTGIPIVGLYLQGKGFQGNCFHDIDVIIFDIQDVGMRHYTHVALLVHVMNIAAQLKKCFVILDHPNILGRRIEGPLPTEQMRSLICALSIPVRYGLTIGELARFINRYLLNEQVQLHVVPFKDYRHDSAADSVWLRPLSPNISTLQSAYGYSFLGLLGEVRPFDVGIGTENAFRVIALSQSISFSDQQWSACMDILTRHGVDSKKHIYFSTRKKEWCTGLLLSIKDVSCVPSFELLMELLLFFQGKLTLRFSDQFDKAVGTNAVRMAIFCSERATDLYKMIHSDLEVYKKRLESCKIYD